MWGNRFVYPIPGRRDRNQLRAYRASGSALTPAAVDDLRALFFQDDFGLLGALFFLPEITSDIPKRPLRM